MRRVLVASVIVAAGLFAAAAGGADRAASLRVAVKPQTGGPRTHFVVGFRAPARTGVFGSRVRRLEVRASGRGAGCATSLSVGVSSRRKGEHVSATLSGPWCVASYRGKVIETDRPFCRKGQRCPAFATRIRTLAHFSFSVLASGGSSDTTPPTFAGLQNAFACTPGPQRPGETTPFTLSWQPASDNQTPSSEIVYDVFLSTTPGGESFASPTWTTAPGVTTFKTPGLASHGTFYFVVRARDQAGNEDHNRVERRGVDPCV